MLNVLLQSPAMLAAVIMVLAFLNYWVGVAVLRAESSQTFFGRAEEATTSELRSTKTRPALPFVTAVPVAIILFFVDDLSRDAFGGGYLVMQLAALIGGLESLMRSKALLMAGAAEGRVVLSAQYRYRSAVAHAVAFAVLAEIVALLFKSLAFAVGGVFLLATAVGWYRRARQSVGRRSVNELG